MAKSFKHTIVFVLALIIFSGFTGCNIKENSKSTFGIEQFQSEIKSKHYKFKMQKVRQYFLPTTTKQMLIGDEALSIYVFKNSRDMEKESRFISSDGYGYKNGSKGVSVDWVAPPRFFKKGNIIVEYVGRNSKLISDLKAILGEQFAGEK